MNRLEIITPHGRTLAAIDGPTIVGWMVYVFDAPELFIGTYRSMLHSIKAAQGRLTQLKQEKAKCAR